MSERRPFTITRVQRSEDGIWRAYVTCNGSSPVEVDRSSGSWQASIRTGKFSREFVRRDVLPHVAAELQAKVRRLERAEKASKLPAQEVAA